MLYWECKRRLALLHRFRKLSTDYFDNIKLANWMAGGAAPTMNEKAQKARDEMNRVMDDCGLSFDSLGQAHVVRYTPPPVIGGYTQTVDVIRNIFDLWQFQIGPHVIFDSLDRAIGAYERECKRLLHQSFNPLYWLGIIITWVLQLPFKTIRAAGFQTTKLETSRFGRVVKLVWVFALGIATFIPAILETAIHWDIVTKFFGKCIAAVHRAW